MDKAKERKKIINKLKTIIADIDENKKRVLETALERIAFLIVELKELESEIAEKGCTEIYQNGANQSGVKVSAASQVYNSLVKNYTALMKEILSNLPKEQKQDKNALMEFLKDG